MMILAPERTVKCTTSRGAVTSARSLDELGDPLGEQLGTRSAETDRDNDRAIGPAKTDEELALGGSTPRTGRAAVDLDDDRA